MTAARPFIIWPDEWQLISIETDFQIAWGTFSIIRPHDRKTWTLIQAHDAPLVLDPCSETASNIELRAHLQARSPRLHVGWQDVRIVIKALRLGR